MDCCTAEEAVEEPVWLAALEAAVPVEDSLDSVDSEAAEEVLDESPEAEDVAEAEESEDELPLAAAVELAAPGAHVADWGRLLTPWPPHRELANWIVSAKQVLLAVVWQTASSRMGCLTLLVGGVTGSADAAREAAQKLSVAADALHVKAATGAERGANTAGCAGGETGDLCRGESGQQSHGGESDSVHVCCVCFET